MTVPAIPAVGDQTAAAWADLLAAGFQAWTTWAPALTATTTNPTLGTGGNTTGRYIEMGGTTHGWGRVNFGTAATAAGSGTYFVSLPTPNSGGGANMRIGVYQIKCAGLYTEGQLSWNGASVAYLQYPSAQVNGTINNAANNLPGAWTANDFIWYQFTYESA